MWFLRRGNLLPAYPLEALLVVDLTETGQPLARTHRLIDEVNRCTRGEQSGSANDAAATTDMSAGLKSRCRIPAW